jgi:hypothetical protein
VRTQPTARGLFAPHGGDCFLLPSNYIYMAGQGGLVPPACPCKKLRERGGRARAGGSWMGRMGLLLLRGASIMTAP